jgi:hypothetical protein
MDGQTDAHGHCPAKISSTDIKLENLLIENRALKLVHFWV